MSTSARVQDLEYLYASNTNVSNIVSVKLSGSNNYHVWKSQMLCLLDSNNMGGIVDAKFVGPRYSGTDTVRQYESLARGWILGSVSEDLLADAHKLGSAKAVWEKLKSIYDLPDSTPTHSVAKMETEDRDANTIEEDANLNQIKVEQDIVPTETDPTNDAIAYYNNVNSYEPFPRMLRRFTENGNWSSIESILQKYKDKVSEIISSDGSQMLHIAVATGQNNFLKKLLLYLDDEQVLQTRYSDGSTALHISAIFGNKDAADLLLKKNSKLLRIKDRKGKEPLQKAYDNMHLDTVVYLLKAVIDDVTSQSSLPNSVHPGDKIVVELLVNAISTKQYDVALELMYTFPKSAATSDDVLMALAKSFPSGLNYVEKLVSPWYGLWFCLFGNIRRTFEPARRNFGALVFDKTSNW